MNEPLTGVETVKLTVPNLEISFGTFPHNIAIGLHVPRTIRNRLKWWLFCQFFPARITHWYCEVRDADIIQIRETLDAAPIPLEKRKYVDEDGVHEGQ